MATTRTKKARAEVEKARLKLAQQQAKLKELEAKKTEFENMDIVDIVRGMSIPLDDLANVLQVLKDGVLPVMSTGGTAPANSTSPLTSGQVDPKFTAPQIKNGVGGGFDDNADDDDNADLDENDTDTDTDSNDTNY